MSRPTSLEEATNRARSSNYLCAEATRSHPLNRDTDTHVKVQLFVYLLERLTDRDERVRKSEGIHLIRTPAEVKDELI